MVYRALILALLTGPAWAGCNIDENPSPFVFRLFGASPAGQWVVTWDEREDTGVFTNSVAPTMTRHHCIVVGLRKSIGTIGAAVQKIRIATDQRAAFDAAWAQFVTLPLNDPLLAPVMADFRADACPKLLPYVPEPCK